jgi:hypothetical protein
MRATPGLRTVPALFLVASGGLAAGCVRRTIMITTEPPGTMVWLNDREIGRSPVQADFDYYGRYDVRLEKDGYEPQMTSGNAEAPWWDWVGLDLVSELLPFTLHSKVQWHYAMVPAHVDRDALIERAEALRSKIVEVEAAEPAPGPTPEQTPPPPQEAAESP